jgi:U3 small nucleolar RNA-associated protein 6
MADVVQGILEAMSGDLIDLQTREIFTESEISEIIQTRRSHEYKLIRSKPSKKHFLSAINYELTLDEELQSRKQELSTKKSPSDKSILKRAQSLFRRFTKIFKHDVSVWKEYIQFCIRYNLKRELSHVLGKCLQLHSRSEDLWIISKCIELNLHKNPESARAVLQRSLELNPKSEKLWVEYFKFEAELDCKAEEALLVIAQHASQNIGTGKLVKLAKDLNLSADLVKRISSF